jgi:hypothetical protein
MSSADSVAVFAGGLLLVYLGLSSIGSEKGTTKLLEENFVHYQVARVLISGVVILFGLGIAAASAASILSSVHIVF